MDQAPLKKYVAEAFGTAVLTLFGCGSAAIAGGTLWTLGVAFAFGLSIVAMAFVIGGISGCHINPAVSLGLFLDRRLSAQDLIGYWIAQFIGGLVGAILLAIIIVMCDLGGIGATGLGTNGFGSASSVGLNVLGAIIVEIILTCIFVLVVLGSTADKKVAPFAGIIIGLTLTFVHILGIPLTGTSVNPARSFGPALVAVFGGNFQPLAQVWVFILAPLVGAALAAVLWAWFKTKAAPRRAGAGVRSGSRAGAGFGSASRGGASRSNAHGEVSEDSARADRLASMAVAAAVEEELEAEAVNAAVDEAVAEAVVEEFYAQEAAEEIIDTMPDDEF